jgi:hypothetical protein
MIPQHLNPNVLVSIGSAPHTNIEDYTDNRNQLFPVFTREGSWTMVHIDPFFKEKKHHPYMEKLGFKKVDDRFVKFDTEMYFVADYIDQEIKLDYLFNFMKRIIKENKRLFVQEYTGRDLFPEFKNILKRFTKQEILYIKDNILWDVSYGNDSGCCTDMLKAKPLFIDNKIFNLACLDFKELQKLILKNPEIDQIISKVYIDEYKSLISIHHVNYRRRVKGDTLLSKNSNYNDNVEPDKIMEIYKEKTLPLIEILCKLKKIPDEIYAKQLDHINNYYLIDLYEWYSFMSTIYN